MTLGLQDDGNLVRIVAPVVAAIPQLLHVIEQNGSTISILQTRVTMLETELTAERGRRVNAEEAQATAEAEAERWYNETLRLEACLP